MELQCLWSNHFGRAAVFWQVHSLSNATKQCCSKLLHDTELRTQMLWLCEAVTHLRTTYQFVVFHKVCYVGTNLWFYYLVNCLFINGLCYEANITSAHIDSCIYTSTVCLKVWVHACVVIKWCFRMCKIAIVSPDALQKGFLYKLRSEIRSFSIETVP